MRAPLKNLLPCLLIPALASCSVARVNESADRVEATADSASTIAAQMRNTRPDRRDTVVFSDKPWVSTKPLSVSHTLSSDCIVTWRPAGAASLQEAAQEVINQCHLAVSITPDALNPAAFALQPQQRASNAPPPIQGGQDMATMLFPASVANGMSLGAGGSMGSSFGSYGPRSLYNIKWNGKVSGFLDLIAARAGVSWRYNPTEKRVEFYYLDTRTFRIYAFDDVNTVDSTVRSGMTTAAGISGDGSGSTGQNGSSGISGDSGSKQTTSSELKTSILSDIENSINSMLTPSMGRMSLSRATGTLTVTDRPEVLNRVQQLVNRENESITKQVLLNVNVLSVALTDKDQLGIDWNLVYKSLNNKWGIGLKNTMPGIDQSAISGSVSILDTANSAWAGSKAMVQALAQQGRVSTVRSPSVTTLNLPDRPLRQLPGLQPDLQRRPGRQYHLADPGRRDQRLQHEPAAVRDGKRRDAAEDQHQHDLQTDVRNADQRGLQSPVPELRHTTVRPEGTPAQRRDLGALRLRPDHRGYQQGRHRRRRILRPWRRADPQYQTRGHRGADHPRRAGLNHGEA